MKHATTAGKKLGSIKRRSVSADNTELVKTAPLSPDRVLPLVIEPAVDGADLVGWARDNKELVDAKLLHHGGLLFRGFEVGSIARFEDFVKAVSGELLEYRERSTPRTQIRNNVYTSTDYPASQSIFPHNENSYQATFPLKLCFCCETAPETGGETPIVDCRRVYARIDPEIRKRFVDKQVMYVRNFGDGIGLSWKSVFQTDDPEQVEAYCRERDIRIEWKDNGHLRMRRVLPAVVNHPKTGEPIWFNHATFFHVSTLEPSVREGLLASFKEEDLPNNTYYGDGSPIEPAVLEKLRGIYRDEKVVFPWRRDDVLLLDNVMTAHAREPYTGERRILTGMAEPRTRQ